MSRSMNPQNNRDLNKVFYTSGPNLVILAWMGDKLSRGKLRVDTWTYGQTQAMTIPEDQNWPRVKNVDNWQTSHICSIKTVIKWLQPNFTRHLAVELQIQLGMSYDFVIK